MHSTGRTILGVVGATILAGTGFLSTARAHDGHDHGGAQHGGVEAKTKRHHFEAVFTKTGVKLYAHDANHKAVDLSRLSAQATFYHPNTLEKPWFSRELKASAASAGQPADSLALAIDLSKAPEEGGKVAFRVAGLSDPAEREASFTVPLTFAGGGDLAVTKATAADEKAIASLKLCPVSHEELGSMGTPLKVTRGGRTTYLCCKGCLKELEANPEKFLGAKAASPKADAKHDHHAH